MIPALYFTLFVLALVMLGIVVGLFGGIFYFTYERPAIFRAMLLPMAGGVVVLNGVCSVLKSMFLFFRAPNGFEPAVWVNLDRETALNAVIEDLCARMNTAPPIAVLVHMGPVFSVMQGECTSLNATPKGRILTVGLPLLSCLSVNEFRAILAHEFAHFTGQDTLYSAFVCRMMSTMEHAYGHVYESIPEQRGLIWLISVLPMKLPLWVLRAYFYLFSRIDMKTSRSREFRADAIAAKVCGKGSFAGALRKVYAFSPIFDPAILGIAEEILNSRHPDESPLRVYRKRIKEYIPVAEKVLEKELQIESMPWDSHPTLTARLEALPNVPESFGDTANALTLFKELPRYEKMTGDFLKNEYRRYRKSRYGMDR